MPTVWAQAQEESVFFYAENRIYRLETVKIKSA